jgi:hypothetical protein
VIWSDAVINYFTETSASVDRVLDIFVRANDGGTKLSKSDLLMSLITSKWENRSARDEIFDFVDHINKELPQPNKITKDFVLKSCLVLCGFDVKYNVANFTQQSIAEIERNWPDIRDALERTFRYLNGLGLNAENLSSLNAVLPIAWFLYHEPGVTLRGTSEIERHNARAIQRWLINSLLMGVFAGNSDRTISAARKTLRPSSTMPWPSEGGWRGWTSGPSRTCSICATTNRAPFWPCRCFMTIWTGAGPCITWTTLFHGPARIAVC